METPDEIGPGVTADVFVDPDAPPERRVRKPFGNRDQKLAYPNREGYHRHWFNDDPGRIMQAEGAGYTHVTDSRGKNVNMVVGIGRGGQPQVAFLMETLQSYFDDDMAAQDGEVIGLLHEIGRGDYTRPVGGDGAARYIGSGRGNVEITSAPGTPRTADLNINTSRPAAVERR